MYDDTDLFISLISHKLFTYAEIMEDVLDAYPMFGGTRDFDNDLVDEYLEQQEIVCLRYWEPDECNYCSLCKERECICTVRD